MALSESSIDIPIIYIVNIVTYIIAISNTENDRKDKQCCFIKMINSFKLEYLKHRSKLINIIPYII